MLDRLNAHRNIALQFSGGKDSLVCLWMLRDYLPRITVYHVGTHDASQDARDSVAFARALAPNFVVIEGKNPRNTIPSDVVPRSATPIGLMSRGEFENTPQIIDSFSCCWHTIMQPLQARMKADGVTLVVRGQKLSDVHRSPLRSGAVVEGVEYLFPLEDMTSEGVFAYLKEHGVPVPKCYDSYYELPDCLNCSGWWSSEKEAYLRKNHPLHFEIVRGRIQYIQSKLKGDLNYTILGE
jgi:phosphoadenosine phosphosulfate reductase